MLSNHKEARDELLSFNPIKAIYDKSIANNILNGGKHTILSLKSGKAQSCPFRYRLCRTVLENLGNTKTKGNIKETFSEEVKVFMFKDGMMVNIRKPKDDTKIFLSS